MKKRILVIAPHPDDEVLGCGGLIAKSSSNGHDVRVLIVSNHDEPVYTKEHRDTTKNETLKAHSLLGVAATYFLDYAAITLKDLPTYELNGAIASVMKEVSPQIVFLPHAGDIHIDHQTVAASAMVAVRPLLSSSVETVLGYETLSETEWNTPRSEFAFMPGVYINISDYIERKLEAVSCFKSQLYEAPHPRSLHALRSLAYLRGSTISVAAAEAFSHIRTVMR